MGLGLKILSLISGSDEKTILNARAEIEDFIGTRSNTSNNSEREYIINALAKEIKNNPRYIQLSKRGIDKSDVVCKVIDDKMNAGDIKELVIMKRVLVQYYGYNNNHSKEGFKKFIDDIVYILDNPY